MSKSTEWSNLIMSKSTEWSNLIIARSHRSHRSLVRSLRPAFLLKKRLWHRCFPVDFAKFHLFESYLTACIFPQGWKKGNVIPVHRKESKNCLKNYRPTSLLSIFSKIF